MKLSYYNENDKKAAAWLRELIKAGVIANGDVDDRSIAEVQGEDLAGYGQCHFFAGIGGWSYALRLAGVPDDEPVWTGSCPCQPFSAAGKQKGEKDERHLWPEFWRLIRERSPYRIFGEQVASSIGFGWIDGVRADLETEAYALGIAVLGAHSVGSPHIRQRLYWVADAVPAGRPEGWAESRHGQITGSLGFGRLGDSNIARSEGRSLNAGEYADQFALGEAGSFGGLDNTADSRRTGSRVCGSNSSPRDHSRLQEPAGRSSLGGLGDSMHSERWTLNDSGKDVIDRRDQGRAQAYGQPGASGEVCGLAEPDGRQSSDRGLQRGRQHGQQPEDGRTSCWSDFDILHCTDGKARRIEAGTFPLATGIPARMGRLRGYGNAIVPQAAAEFIIAATEAIKQEKQK